MKNKKFILGLLCLAALGVTACGGNNAESTTSSEPTSSSTTPAHTHNFEFQSFVWTLTPGAYTAKAHYVCSADEATEDHDATVTKVTTVAPTCGEDGKNVWKAVYDGYEETKEEVLPATGNHSYTRVAHETVGNVFVFTCDVCDKVVYEAHLNSTDIYYFDFVEGDAPTLNTNGSFTLRFYNYDSVNDSFTLRSQEETVAKGINPCIIPNFKENGSEYVIDQEHSTVTIRTYISLMIAENRTQTGLGLLAFQPIMRTYFAECTITFPFDLANDAPEMKYEVQVLTPESYSGHTTSTPLVSFKAARKDGFNLPIKEEIPERTGYNLLGFSSTSGGAKEFEFNQFIEIPLDVWGAMKFYCVWQAA